MNTREQNIDLPMDQIRDFCRHNPIRRLSLFGSVLRDDFTEKSDVDFLVELEPEARIGLFEFIRLQNQLEDLTGKKADLRTAEDLHPRFRTRIVDEAELIYERQD